MDELDTNATETSSATETDYDVKTDTIVMIEDCRENSCSSYGRNPDQDNFQVETMDEETNENVTMSEDEYNNTMISIGSGIYKRSTIKNVKLSSGLIMTYFEIEFNDGTTTRINTNNMSLGYVELELAKTKFQYEEENRMLKLKNERIIEKEENERMLRLETMRGKFVKLGDKYVRRDTVKSFEINDLIKITYNDNTIEMFSIPSGKTKSDIADDFQNMRKEKYIIIGPSTFSRDGIKSVEYNWNASKFTITMMNGHQFFINGNEYTRTEIDKIIEKVNNQLNEN